MEINKKLKSILRMAYDNCPYYTEVFNSVLGNNYDFENITYDDFSKIPLLSRNEIVVNTSRIINQDLTAVDIKELIVTRTSGTVSGYPLEIYWSLGDYVRANTYSWEIRKKCYGILPRDRYVSFHTYSYFKNKIQKLQDVEYSKDRINLSLGALDITDEKLHLYFREITNFKPRWMFISPHLAIELIEYLNKYNLSFPDSLEYIECTGEVLLPSVQNAIKEYFKIPVVNFYGSMETNGIAIQCPCGNMHVLDKNVYVEKIEDQIVVTCLSNTKMPLIRYCLGDNIEIDYDGNCQCGNSAPIITKISGKESVSFENEGEVITEKKLAYCIERINSLFFDCIMQYRLLKRVDHILFRIYIEEKYEHWEDEILFQLRKELESMGIITNTWEFSFQTTNIKNMKYYKFKNIVIE